MTKTKLLKRLARNLSAQNCNICKDTFSDISKAMDEEKIIHLVLNPDRNISGHVMRWHIGVTSVEE